MFSCDWCGKAKDRVWQIPNSSDREKQWVCKEHYDMWLNDEVDSRGQRKDGKSENRVI